MKTAIEIRDQIASGQLKAVDIVRECLDAIKAEDDKLGAFLETFDDEALEAAAKIDELVSAGSELPRLAGVPIAIKDNILIQGHVSSAGSKMLEKYEATYDATVISRLKQAGVIIIGRTNMDEFAMGSSTENSAWHKTRNPHDHDKVPGGSSGGSAVAVAAGFVSVALGSDTAGSVRQPAALCGVVGMKPTYGRVSRYGLIAFASSFDQIGVIAQNALDAALILEVIEGGDEQDATSLDLTSKTVAELITPSLEGLKIGIAKEMFREGMDREVRDRIDEAIMLMQEHGAEIVEVSLPLVEYGLPAYYILQPAEASSNLARFDGLRYGTRAQSDDLQESYLQARGYGFGLEVKRRIMVGTYVLSAGYYDAYYKKAQAVRTAIFKEIKNVFKEVDLLLSPTSPSVAWEIGEKFADPITMYLSDIYTVTANVIGAPAISVPCGKAHNLPVGLQFMADIDEDHKVLQAAAAYQEAQKVESSK